MRLFQKEVTTANQYVPVKRYNGVSIDNNGSLSITPSATAGTVTVSAECGGIKKSINLVLKSLGNADTIGKFTVMKCVHLSGTSSAGNSNRGRRGYSCS